MSDKSKGNEPTIERVFDLLNRWRHLPAYQLERRADIFFALFLPEVLQKHLAEQGVHVKIDDTLIPEFPIKKSGGNQSTKADYLALSLDRKRAFLIELKTDMDSRRKDQDRILKNAAEGRLCDLVRDVIEICRATKERVKYVHLIENLLQLGLVEHRDENEDVREKLNRLYEIAAGGVGNFKDVLNSVVPADISTSVDVVYVQPRNSDTIDFCEFARTIEDGGSEGVRCSFASYLRQWGKKDAGFLDPKSLYR